MLIIPPVVEAEAVTKAADLRNHALHMHMRKLTVTNQPDWPFPPFLKDALVHLPQRTHSLTPAEGTIHKFQAWKKQQNNKKNNEQSEQSFTHKNHANKRKRGAN